MAESEETEPTDDATGLAVDELAFFDVGRRLAELADQLRAVSNLIDNDRLHEDNATIYQHGSAQAVEHFEEDLSAAFRRTLSGLRAYRRNYNFWERVIAEYALTKMHYTQRDTAALLGVGVSTINRWAQNPLPIEDYR